jgi:hypothetical protein
MLTYAICFFVVGMIVAIIGIVRGVTSAKEARVDERLPANDILALLLMVLGGASALSGIIIGVVALIKYLVG